MYRSGFLGEENKPNRKIGFFKNCFFFFFIFSNENNVEKLVGDIRVNVLNRLCQLLCNGI